MAVYSKDYSKKESSYYARCRPEMARFVPNGCRRLLDVGCGEGGFAGQIRVDRSIEAWGVEPFAPAAEIASRRLDRVFCSVFDSALGLPHGYFDCIVFNDVLEHVLDLGAALELAKNVLVPGGVLVASLPNIRHFPTLWEIAVRGEWTYREFGIMDRTHLRFFTKKSIPAVLSEHGFQATRVEGINPYISLYNNGVRWRYFRILNVLTFGSLSDARYLQFAVQAIPASPKPTVP